MSRTHSAIGFTVLFVLIVSSPSLAQKGTVELGTITTPALGGVTKNFRVYLPPSYTTSEKAYPSFYVLHGYDRNEGELTGIAHTMDRMIQDGEIGEMIAVFVDGDEGWYIGEYEPYIIRDLLQYVDAHYRTIPDRNSRGVTGYSMGGYGSIHLALKYPEVFSVAVPQAGAYWTWGRNIEEDLAPYLDQSVRLNGIKIVHGRRDDLTRIGDARAFDKKLTELGIEHVYLEHGGGHRFYNKESAQFLSDHLHPVHQIARLREGVSVTTTPGAAVLGEPFDLTMTLDLPPQDAGAVQSIFLDLSALDLSSEFPLEHAGEGRYTLSRTIAPPRSGPYRFPMTMETAFEWDMESTRYALLNIELVVYPPGDTYIYRDEIGSGWEAEVGKGDVDLAASDVVRRGSHAHTVSLQSGGSIKYTFYDPEGFSTFGYTGLEFWIHPGTTPTDLFRLGLILDGAPSQYPTLKEDLGITLAPDVWQRISIPLDDLGIVDSRLEAIRFDKVEGTFHVDDLAFVVSEYPLSAPEVTLERIKGDGVMSTLLSVKAEPAVMVIEPGAPPAVTVDLSPIGGDRETRMFDDGTGGDWIAGDGIYTVEVTVSSETPKGIRDLVISSTDSHLRVDRVHIPLTVLPSEDVYVYRDEIAPGWKVSVRNVLSDPSATAFVYDGEYAQEISVKRSSNFVNYTWDDAEGFDAFGYTDLVFQVLVTESEQDPEVRLTPVTGDAVSFRLGDQLGAPGAWQKIWIPLGGLADAGFLLKRFSFQRVDATLYIDDVRFAAEEVQVYTEPTAVEVVGESIVPFGYALSQNHPNPFNPETTIRYELAETGAVRLSVYNVSGQLIRTLVDGEHPAGTYSVTWDGTDDTGQDVASGVYIARMATVDFGAVRKLVLVR